MNHLVSLNGHKLAVNCEEQSVIPHRNSLVKFLPNLKHSTIEEMSGDLTALELKDSKHVLYPLPFAVNYTAKSFKCVPYTHPDSAPLQVLASLMTSHFLHKELREKGGAYGGSARYASLTGIFSMMTYR